MLDLLADLERGLAAAERTWLRDALARGAREGARAVAALLPALPRRIGRHAVGTGMRRAGEATVDARAWRACDLAAYALLAQAGSDDAARLDLYAHGDIEERTMLLRASSALPLSPATASLFGEIQRSNTVPHFEALACDSDVVARACGTLPGFGPDQLNRLLLKAAFLGLRLARLFAVERHANPELSRMLADLASEREAAGRAVWPDTALLLARAPVPGTRARLVGDLEHGDDERRAAAAAGLGLLRDAALMPFLRERLPREPKPVVQQALRDALARGEASSS
jgi:hypothetical protein